MMNDRPIDDPNLQLALDEIRATMLRHGFAGAVIVVAPQEAAYTYVMHAPWSAIRPDPGSPLGWRVRASVQEDGAEGRHERLEGAAHTICQLSDFGAQTMDWMEQLKVMLRRSGLEIEHNPFGGKPIPSLALGQAPKPRR